MPDVNMQVELAGVTLKNPVVVASGTFGFGREYSQFYDLGELGGICAKGLTLHPRNGNPAPRIAETPMGILNSVGLENPGVDAFIKEELPFLRQFDTKIIANISGDSPEEYGVMCEKAGHKPEAKALSATNIYGEILAASQALDDAEVPETGRVLVVTPAVYALLKKSKDITMETDIGNDLRLKGVISNLDGMSVQKIPANRLPAGFGFMIAHPCATVAPTKLEDYTIHDNPPGISGSLVEGRICYDAFTLDNKVKAVYYQAQPSTGEETKE